VHDVGAALVVEMVDAATADHAAVEIDVEVQVDMGHRHRRWIRIREIADHRLRQRFVAAGTAQRGNQENGEKQAAIHRGSFRFRRAAAE
jgi:hypothetical protein